MTPRILIVDDDRPSADMMEYFLQQYGFATRVAYDGFVAADIASDFCPNVVLMDIMMPGMNGLDAAQVLRECSSSERLYFIALTGLSEEKHRKHTREAGFHLHLVKPLSTDLLNKLVQTLNFLAA